MFTKIWYKINNTVMGGALIIAFFSFLSKVFGLIRERLIAGNFGAGQVSDIYYSAFRLPDLIFNTLVLGALTSAFIPVFQKIWFKDKQEGLKLANSVLNLFLLFIGLLTILAIIFAGEIMPLITPGFSDTMQTQNIALTRIMLLAVILFVASNIIGGILNSWKRFFSFSLAASFYNIGIILGIVWFYPRLGMPGLAWGVFLGAAMHLVIQLPEVYKHGYRYQFVLKWSKDLKRILALMVPRTMGLAASQLNLVIITIIASTLASGSIAIFNLANNLASLPISLFAVSLAVAVFPTFTEAASQENHQLFAHNFSISLRQILYLLIPISAFIVILRAQIVRVILGTGSFTWEDTYYTAQVLGFFALSIFAQGLIPLLARSFYAFEDTKTPTAVSIFCVVLNIVLSWILAEPFGIIGLALGFSISSITNMLILYAILHWRIPHLNEQKILSSLGKIALGTVVSGAFVYASLDFLAGIVNMRTFWGIFTQGVASGLLGLLVYVILSILLKMEEVSIIRRMLKKTLGLLKNGQK